MISPIEKLLQESKELEGRRTRGKWSSDSCGDIWTDAETEWCPGLDQHIFRTFATTTKGPDSGNAKYITHLANTNAGKDRVIEVALERLGCPFALDRCGKCGNCLALAQINEIAEGVRK